MKQPLIGIPSLLLLLLAIPAGARPGRKAVPWEPLGLSGGGGMFSPAISPADGRRMIVHCDMSGVYRTADGGRNWTMIHHSELRGNTRCRPVFHPVKAGVVFSASGWNSRRLMVSTDGGIHWTERGILPAPLRGEIAIDPDAPDLMLAGAGQGAFRSRDAGRSWSRCDGVTGEVVGFHFDRTSPPGRRTLFAGTTEGIWRSDDGGRSWAPKTRGLGARPVRSFAGGSRSRGGKKRIILYATVPSRLEGDRPSPGVFRSLDRGETWEPVEGEGLNRDTSAFDRWAMGPIAQYHQVLVTDVDPRRVYVFNSNTGVAQPHHATVYRSDDAGRTWRAVFDPDPRWEPTNVDKSYVTAEDNQFYQSVPFGAAIDAADPDHLLFVTSWCWITRDGGKSWFPGFTRVKPGEKKPEGNRRAPGLDWVCNGLVVTTTWNIYEDPFRPRRLYICYTDLGFARSVDGGRTFRWWSERGRAPWRNTCYELAFDPSIPGKVWGAFSNVHDIPNANIIRERHRSTGPGGICLSTDFTETWEPLAGGLPVAPATTIVVDPGSPRGRRRLFAGFFGKGVYRSLDDGRTWRPVNLGLGAESNRRVCRVVLHPDGTLFALVTARRAGGEFRPEGVGLYRSRDGGESWDSITRGQPFLWPKDFTVDPANSRVIYLGNSDTDRRETGGLYRTRDGGRTWKRIARKGPQTFGAWLHPRHPGWIYMTLTEGAPGPGLWLSKDEGRTFTPLDGLPFRNAQRVTVLPSDPNRIYVTTFGGGVWRGPPDR